MLKRSAEKTICIAVLAVVVLAMRLLPHLPNFAAIGAFSLLTGYYLRGNLKFALPLVVVFISDIFIGFYSLPMMIAVYASYVLMACLGSASYQAKGKLSPRSVRLILATLGGSLLFYLITNAAVVVTGTMYPHTLAGLYTSYINALPFFRNSLASDVAYTGSFVLAIEALSYLAQRIKLQRQAAIREQ